MMDRLQVHSRDGTSGKSLMKKLNLNLTMSMLWGEPSWVSDEN